MTAVLLDGNALAAKIKAGLKAPIAAVKKARGLPPSLMLIGAAAKDPSARSYRLAQLKAAADVGVSVREFSGRWKSAREILGLIESERDGDGVVLDLPLPGIDVAELLSGMPPDRDAEGVTPYNFGRLFQARTYASVLKDGLMVPCTALAVCRLLGQCPVPLAGKSAAVLGRSNIVGKPVAHLLSCLDLTVTLCHSKTPDLAQIVARADVVVAAAGKAQLVASDWIKPGAVVIDAGINVVDGKLCGDVDPRAGERAGYLTPVPGGVGPVTTAMLLGNVVALAESRCLR